MARIHRSWLPGIIAAWWLSVLTASAKSLSTPSQTSDSLIVETLRQNGINFSHNNSVTLLMSGQEKFDDMFKSIRQAKSSIHLEYFNFRNDSIASLLFDLLREKRKEGVEVRAMFDGFGNDSNNQPLKKHHLVSLRKDSIDIVEYSPIRFPWVNKIFGRDHRKIVVIDGKIAYLKDHGGEQFFDPKLAHIFPREDYPLCVAVDRFDFVLRVEKEEEALVIRKTEIGRNT